MSGMDAGPARTVAGVLLGTPLVALALLLGMQIGILDAVMLSGFLVLLPGLSVAQVSGTGEIPLPSRSTVYAISAGTSLVVGGVAVAAALPRGPGATLSLRPLPSLELAIWSLALALTALLFVWLVRITAAPLGVRDTPILREMLPRTPGERLAFVGVSLSAGIGEELAFRGYVLGVLAETTGRPWAAAVAAAVAFGMVHAYQGFVGMLRTGIVGLALAAPVILTGSIWPAVGAHALFDVLAGSVLGERLLIPRDGDSADGRA